MNDVINWIFEPFTKPQYQLTFVDGLKGIAVILIILALIFGIVVLVLLIKNKKS